MAYVAESDVARLHRRSAGCRWSAAAVRSCGDLGLQRQRMKKLLFDLEREHPGLKRSVLKALGNVQPRHLLDRRLNPPRARCARRASQARDASAASRSSAGYARRFVTDGS